MKTNQVTDRSGKVQNTCEYCYGEQLRADYNPATDYRIFIRSIDDETGATTYSLFNSYADIIGANKARAALNRDEARFTFVCPGDADPAVAGQATEREVVAIRTADAAQAAREERGL